MPAMIWVLIAFIWLLALGLTWVTFRRGRLRTPWHLDVAALGLLAVAALGFFWRVVTGQNWMPADGGDLVSFLYPTYRFAAAMLRSGHWPLWNPYLYGGAPHVGDIQAGFLYPPNLLLFLLRPGFPYRTLEWFSIGHIWFAGAGMYLLLARGLRVNRVAALTGALAFMFCDAFIIHFGNLNLNAAASWLPWIFWAYLAGLRNGQYAIRKLWWPAISGSLLAVATLAGHIQTTLFIILALAVYTGFWVWFSRKDSGAGQRAAFGILSWLVCVLIAVLLSAPVLLSAIQLAGRSARAGWNYQEAAGYSLSPAQWVGWLVPGFFGRSPQLHWGAWPRVEAGYLGILPLILAALALALRRDRGLRAWAGLAAVSFILALGIYAIPHGWLTLLPGFGQLRAPARMVLVTDFALAVLASFGLDALLQPLSDHAGSTFDRSWRLVAYATVAVLAIVVPLVYVTLILVQGRDEAIVVRSSIALSAVMAFVGLLVASLLWLTARRGNWTQPQILGWLAVALIMLDLASLGAYEDLGNDDPSLGFQQPAIAGFLAGQPGPFRVDARTEIDDVWQPDTALLYGFEDLGGLVNPLVLADADRYWNGLGSRSTRLYDLLNAQYVIGRKDIELDWDKFALAFDGDPKLNVYLNRRVLPRAFTVGQIQPVTDHEAAWATIQEPGFDPGVTAVVEGATPPGGGRGEVGEVRTEPGRVLLQVTADAPVLLVLSQMWYPGWQTWVDGVPQGAPLRTDYTFQGVPLAAGVHQVELRFIPQFWRLGWVLAGLTVAGLAVLAAVTAMLRRKT